MPPPGGTQAVAGHGDLLGIADQATRAKRLEPRFHVRDLAERPAFFLDLQRVRRLVVARRVVGEFGRAEGQD